MSYSSNSPFYLRENDLGIKNMTPRSPTDVRVPMAEEFDLSSRIGIELFSRDRKKEWREYPVATKGSGRSFSVEGKALLPCNPSEIILDLEISLPQLIDSTSEIYRRDRLYLVGFVSEVGADQDPILGTVNFSFQTQNSFQGVQQENSRRYRSFWVLWLSPQEIDEAGIYTAIGNSLELNIANKSNTGYSLGTYQVYALDPNLVLSKSYRILERSVAILPIAAFERRQRMVMDGYTFGLNGEEMDFTAIIPTYSLNSSGVLNIQSQVERRIFELCGGKVGVGSAIRRGVGNLVLGSNPSNPGRLGTGIISPNGSAATANDMRFSFTNQKILEQRGGYRIALSNSGNGIPLAAIGLNTNSPSGSRFSPNASDHKIYALDGSDQSDFGIFLNLGGTGSLQWLGTANSTLEIGESAIFVPAIEYPSGSGFRLPFTEIVGAWVNNRQIASQNIRKGIDDLSEYESPKNGDDFIIIYGTERSAIHYIYKRISLTIPGDGIAVIPPEESGIFAFIQGVDGRVDSPIVKNLTPNTTTSALVYYSPKSTENWQFEFLYPEYQGLGSSYRNWIEGSEVIGSPVVIGHTHGGGNSVFLGSKMLRYSPISSYLPNGETDTYEIDTPIYLEGESNLSRTNFRRLEIIAGTDGILPSKGSIIETYDRGIFDRVKTINFAVGSDGEVFSFKTPTLVNNRNYQSLVAIPVAKNGVHRLLIATGVVGNSENINFDPVDGMGVDLFEIL